MLESIYLAVGLGEGAADKVLQVQQIQHAHYRSIEQEAQPADGSQELAEVNYALGE